MKLVTAEAGIFAGELVWTRARSRRTNAPDFVLSGMSIFTFMFAFNIQPSNHQETNHGRSGIFTREHVDSYKEQKNEFTRCFVVFWMGIFTFLLGMVTTS